MLEALIKILLLVGGLMVGAMYLVLLERKVAAWVQDRRGPNRVGLPLTKTRLGGLGQPMADAAKLLLKEDYTPAHVDRRLFWLAPLTILAAALAAFAVIPFGSVLPAIGGGDPIPLVVAPQVDVGMIYVFALSGIAVYGVILGGWASNNKYSFLGGLRSSAQLIAYELPLGLGILGIVLASGSLRLDTIIGQQAETGVWNIFAQPLGLIVFTVAAFAEAARLPFDLPEAEQELVGGYHTEFSGMKLVAFLTAEFLHMIAAAFLIVILFLGGWHFWFITGSGDEIGWLQAILRVLVLAVKVLAVIFFFMLVRWSWPRFRFDQLMSLAWKVMLPLGLIHLVAVAVMGEISHNVRLGYAESLVGARLSQDERGVVLRAAGGQGVAAPPSEDPASGPVSGLQVGDRLVAVGNRSVKHRDQVVRALVAHDPGDELTVRVERRGQEKEQTVRLGRPPPADAGLGAEYSSDYGSGMARSIGAISVTVQWLVAFAACAAFAILGAILGDNRPRHDLQIHDIDDQL